MVAEVTKKLSLDPGNGITYGYDGSNETINQAMTAFTAIAWASCVELLVLIFVVFKKYEGTYFWSLLISTTSVIPYALGAWIKQVQTPYMRDIPPLLPTAFLNISWLVLIPGQSIVLWSRLHLITHNHQLLRFIIWLIIVNWFLFCIPTTVFTWGSSAPVQSPPFIRGYIIYEKIQMVAFSMQEIFISGVYVWEVRKVLGLVYEKKSRKIMWELVAINVFIIILDIALLVVEFLNLYMIETTFKGMVYAIKLKLEFGVLSKLVHVVLERKDTHACIPSKELGEGTALDMDDYVSNHEEQDSSHGLSTQSSKSRLGSVSTRKGSIQHVENMSRDFNLPPDWRYTAETSYTIPEEPRVAGRPKIQQRNSTFSDMSVSYPGRLDSTAGV